MEIDETSAVINALKSAAGGGETWRLETFAMERESTAHGWQTVIVTIKDRGSEISPRYGVSAVTDDGEHRCAGNTGDDLDTVIALTHWENLDR